jgi:vacuolar-type H+-ATPase subunit E/Vma4
VVEQTHALAGVVKERKVKATETIEDAKTRAQEAIAHSVAAQKTALDYSAKQAKAAFETAKQQLGYEGTPAGTAAESMKRGVEVVVEAQKELLDVLAAPTLH